MDCPSCRKKPLQPVKLEYGLPVMGCGSCGGALLSLVTYRAWAEGMSTEATEASVPHVTGEPEDTKGAMQCPKCDKLMTKYRVSSDTDNRMDLCSWCAEAWLDGGEWELLKRLHLENELPAIFSGPWQERIRHHEQSEAHEARYRKIFGDEDYEKAREIRDWLAHHPNESVLKFYLTNIEWTDDD